MAGRDPDANLPEKLHETNETPSHGPRGGRSDADRPRDRSTIERRGETMTDYWNDADSPFHPASAPDYLPADATARSCSCTACSAIVPAAPTTTSRCSAQRMDERGRQARRTSRPSRTSRQLPFTVKTDLRDTYPFGLFASPMSEVVRAARLQRHHRQADRGGLHRRRTSTSGPSVMVRTFAACGAAPRATSSRTPTATACSPAAWARTTAPRRWAPPSSPSPAATPTARSW